MELWLWERTKSLEEGLRTGASSEIQLLNCSEQVAPIEKGGQGSSDLRNVLLQLNHGGGKDEAENREKLIENRRCL